jgi:hypothetical protein
MSGTVTFGTTTAMASLSGRTFIVADKSCQSLLNAVAPAIPSTNQFGCSADTVVVGTVIRGGSSVNATTTLGTVTAISAPDYSSFTDSVFLTLVVAAAAIMFAGFLGFRQGSSS